MEKFVDALASLIIQNEIPRIDNVMREVTEKISIDFANKIFSLVDEYYDNYTPINYVRVYGPKRKLRTKSGKTSRKSKGGQVSLHAAITRGGENTPAIGVAGGSFEEGYFGGVAFDPEKFKGNGMRHIGKGENFTEWDIVENFLFAGEGGYGDIRSHIEYNHLSADKEMWDFMKNYDEQLRGHYDQALKNNP